MKSITFTIHGELMSKSNSRIFTSFGGKPRLIKKPKALQYCKDARIQLRTQLGHHRAFENPVRMTIIIWYKNKMPDLDVSLIQDILQQEIDKKTKRVIFEGAYKNDRQVYEIHALKKFDKENPRLTVTIDEI